MAVILSTSNCKSSEVDNIVLEGRFSATEPTTLLYLEDTYKFSHASARLMEVGIGERGLFFIFNETIFYPKGGGQPADIGYFVFDSTGRKYEISFVTFDGSTGRVLHHLDKSCELSELELEQFRSSILASKSSITAASGETIHSADSLPGGNALGPLTATLFVNESRRRANAKAHTAGHLLDAVVGTLQPLLKGKIGCHDPSDDCYVKFEGVLDPKKDDTKLMIEQLNSMISECIAENRSVKAISPVENSGSAGGSSDDENDDDGGKSTELITGSSPAVPKGKECRYIQIEGFEPAPCGGTHLSSLQELECMTVKKITSKKKEGMTKISYSFQ